MRGDRATLKVVYRLLRNVSRAWVKDRKRDPYYRKAKAKGYRSRAAYKLMQINRRFRVIRRGDVIVDLGAAPGGWSQLASEAAGPGGRVVALDLVPMSPIEGVTLLRGDLREESTLERLLPLIPGGADCVLSDMSPRLSGSKSLDHARSVELAEAALNVAKTVLRPRGNFVTKLFQGQDYDKFLRRVSKSFGTSKSFVPPASPARSSETYIVAKGWLGLSGARRKI